MRENKSLKKVLCLIVVSNYITGIKTSLYEHLLRKYVCDYMSPLLKRNFYSLNINDSKILLQWVELKYRSSVWDLGRLVNWIDLNNAARTLCAICVF